MTITTLERDKYELLAGAVPQYVNYAPAELFLPVFLELAAPARGATMLDAGCCTGKGGLLLHAKGFDVTLCDLTDAHLIDDAKALPFVQASLWDDLELYARGKGHPGRTRFDYVVCCDVLEHIPQEFTMLVLRNLLAVATEGVFLSIALGPDVYGAIIGESLHVTVQPYVWWRDRLAELATVVESRDLLNVGLYYVRPR